jgi:hypothetical protein
MKVWTEWSSFWWGLRPGCLSTRQMAARLGRKSTLWTWKPGTRFSRIISVLTKWPSCFEGSSPNDPRTFQETQCWAVHTISQHHHSEDQAQAHKPQSAHGSKWGTEWTSTHKHAKRNPQSSFTLHRNQVKMGRRLLVRPQTLKSP